MNRILTQCRKELLQFRRDRLTTALAFVLPFLTLLIYGFAIRLETKDIHLVIKDYDQSKLSRRYVEQIKASLQLVAAEPPLLPRPNKHGWEPTVEDALDEGTAKAGVIIPPDFSRRIKQGKTAEVQVLVDGADVVNARIIKDDIFAITTAYLSATRLQNNPQRLAGRIRIWFNPGRRESLFIVPGVFTVTLALFPAILSAIAMVREKEEGNILQVYASSITAHELLLGKALAYLCIAIVEAVFVIGMGILIFKVRFVGNPTPFLVGAPVFLFSTVMFGIMVGTRIDSQSSAIQIVGSIKAMTAILLSGFIYPLNNIPFPISLISYIIPARYFMEMVRNTFVRGAGWENSWYLIVMLAVLGGLEFLFAWRAMRKMQLSPT